MTEYELIDAYQSVEASWQGAVSIYISIIFAFLATAYFVGEKLSRPQIIIVTGLYTLFSLFMLRMLATLLRRMTQLGTDISAISPDRAFADDSSLGVGLVMWVGVFLSAYIAGLIFMFQLRRNARKHRPG